MVTSHEQDGKSMDTSKSKEKAWSLVKIKNAKCMVTM
jgi:hypothetical protein